MVRRPGVLRRWAICDLGRHAGGAGRVSKLQRRESAFGELDFVLCRPHRRDCERSAIAAGLGARDRVGSLDVCAASPIIYFGSWQRSRISPGEALVPLLTTMQPRLAFASSALLICYIVPTTRVSVQRDALNRSAKSRSCQAVPFQILHAIYS